MAQWSNGPMVLIGRQSLIRMVPGFGCWLKNPSETYDFVTWDDEIPDIWKNKTCSKPPTSNEISEYHGDMIPDEISEYHENMTGDIL